MRTKLCRNERGTALLETAITIPIILLIAAREGARVSVLSDKTDGDVDAAVRAYMQAGSLPGYASAGVVIDRGVAMGANTGSRITVNYPFSFIVLNGVANLVTKGSTAGQPLTMQSVALMRNEF
jgi:hypothetical protein